MKRTKVPDLGCDNLPQVLRVRGRLAWNSRSLSDLRLRSWQSLQGVRMPATVLGPLCTERLRPSAGPRKVFDRRLDELVPTPRTTKVGTYKTCGSPFSSSSTTFRRSCRWSGGSSRGRRQTQSKECDEKTCNLLTREAGHPRSRADPRSSCPGVDETYGSPPSLLGRPFAGLVGGRVARPRNVRVGPSVPGVRSSRMECPTTY
jgi:hypothetical protein